MVYYLIRRQTVLSPYAILKEGEIFLQEADKIHQCAVDAAKEEKQAIAVFTCHELSFFEIVVLQFLGPRARVYLFCALGL